MSERAYSGLSITLHWLIALLIVGNLAGGFFASGLLESEVATDRQLGFRLIQLHKSFGLTVLVLSLARLLLRIVEGFPPLPAHMTRTERVLAKLTHGGFYALMIGIPVAGWVMVSASPIGLPTFWFGLFAWPHLPVATSADLAERASGVHEALAIGAIVLLVLHVGAALKHHFLDRDEVLARMLPFLRQRRTA
ncbi:MAG: cytochrome b [Sphingomonadaceae bacterium]